MNQSLRRASGFAPAVLVSVAFLFVVLAVIQFRWIDRLAAAERQRLQDDIEMTAFRAHESWYRELTHAAMTFGWLHVVERATRDDAPVFIRLRYRGWKATSVVPMMVKRVKLAERIGPTVTLSEFNPETEAFESRPWPADYDALRRRLETTDGIEAIQSQGNDIPVIVGAVFAPPSTFDKATVRAGAWRWSAILVELDNEYLRARFLPELIRTHFATAAVDAFDVVVLDSAGGTIYPAGKLPIQTPDVRIEFYERPLLQHSTSGDEGSLPRSVVPPGHQESELIPLPASLRWELLASYQAGSIDAAVQPLRFRNQLASAAILFTLAAAITVTCIAAARMRRFAALQVEYIAGVSHELRTPLAVIRTGLYNISSGAVSTREQIREYALELEAHTDRLTHMVEQVLLHARTQAGSVRYDIQPLRVVDVVEHALGLLSSALQQSKAAVRCQLDPGLPLVAADSTALTHCIQNVLSNAVKYSNGTPHVDIEATMNPVAGMVELTIADQGIGIADADLPHVFEPFYRGAHPAIAGAGLGLSLVKQMMERQNGRVSIETSSSGTRLTLSIPVARDAVRQRYDSPMANPAH